MDYGNTLCILVISRTQLRFNNCILHNGTIIFKSKVPCIAPGLKPITLGMKNKAVTCYVLYQAASGQPPDLPSHCPLTFSAIVTLASRFMRCVRVASVSGSLPCNLRLKIFYSGKRWHAPLFPSSFHQCHVIREAFLSSHITQRPLHSVSSLSYFTFLNSTFQWLTYISSSFLYRRQLFMRKSFAQFIVLSLFQTTLSI